MNPTEPARGPGGRQPSVPLSMGQLGMVILLISITVLFFAACVAVVFTRRQVEVWRVPGNAGLPWGTAASTAFLGVVSWQLQVALVAMRNNQFTRCLQRWRWAAFFAAAFLFSQALNARHLAYLEGSFATRGLFVFCYDLLVGLHAAHVIGGLIPLAVVHARIAGRDYSSSRHAGLTFCVQYWHYLGAIWLVLLATLAWIG